MNPLDWHFSSYEKIYEKTEHWNYDEQTFHVLKKEPWVVTEKIHGANFCFVTDGTVVRCAKRKVFLQDDESFFGHHAVYLKHHQLIQELFVRIAREQPNLARIAVYGELFGGSYPHNEVLPILGVQPIQTGVYYCPHIEFGAFDIALEYYSSSQLIREYLDYEKAIAHFESIGIFYAKPLLIGTYNEAIHFNVGFESGIPKHFELPKLSFSNVAEGVVIKPVRTLKLMSTIRPILKKKVQHFAEDARFHQSEKWAESIRLSQNGERAFEFLESIILTFCTHNRIRNVISKVGLDGLDRSFVAAEVFEDCIQQLYLEYGSLMSLLTTKQNLQLHEALQQHIQNVLNNEPALR